MCTLSTNAVVLNFLLDVPQRVLIAILTRYLSKNWFRFYLYTNLTQFKIKCHVSLRDLVRNLLQIVMY